MLNYIGSGEVYEKHFTHLCSYLKEKNIHVEINLLGVRDNRHYTSEKFLKIAQKVGNSVIIGCDAHTPEALSTAKDWNKCLKLAEKFGLEVVELLPGLE